MFIKEEAVFITSVILLTVLIAGASYAQKTQQSASSAGMTTVVSGAAGTQGSAPAATSAVTDTSAPANFQAQTSAPAVVPSVRPSIQGNYGDDD